MGVSEIAFGGIPIMKLTQAQAVRVLRHAVDLGITYFDTARGYADSEAKMGEALVGQECSIASKSPARDAEGMRKELEASLHTLRRECLEVYQMHHLSTPEDLEQSLEPGGAVEALQQAQQDGKLRFIGVSGHNRRTLCELVRQAGDVINVVQTLFNPLEADALDELVPLCARHGIGIVAMKAVGGGIFDCPTASMKWILSHPEISCTDPGMASIEEVEANARIGSEDLALTDAEQRAIESLRARLDKAYCRRCGECLPCPKGIDIVSIMIGDSLIMRMGRQVYEGRGFAEKLERIAECHDCDVCLPKCPAGLSIPELLPLQVARIKELAEAQ